MNKREYANTSIIITTSEARKLLGLGKASLTLLERAAGVARPGWRAGYSDGEFRALVDALRSSLDETVKG